MHKTYNNKSFEKYQFRLATFKIFSGVGWRRGTARNTNVLLDVVYVNINTYVDWRVVSVNELYVCSKKKKLSC